MKKKLFLILLMAAFGCMQAQSTFFPKAEAFLAKHVEAGLVNYANIKANPSDLNELVKLIGNYGLSSADAASKKAFLLDAYNILVIKNVVDHFPIAKPTDVPGFFDQIKFNVAGTQSTLSDIENKKIRPVFNDPRVHFALVCAAKSCPPISKIAFSPTNVEPQLEALAKAAMNNPNFIQVDVSKQTVQFSQILDWYKEDFLASSKTVLDFVNTYRKVPIPATFKQSFYEYNWALNGK